MLVEKDGRVAGWTPYRNTGRSDTGGCVSLGEAVSENGITDFKFYLCPAYLTHGLPANPPWQRIWWWFDAFMEEDHKGFCAHISSENLRRLSLVIMVPRESAYGQSVSREILSGGNPARMKWLHSASSVKICAC